MANIIDIDFSVGQQLTSENMNEIVAAINELNNNMTSVTYSQLVELRDLSTLIPGMYYRVTDYVTTTTQANTQSAGHAFDIIVVADSEDVLNENARAIQHSGDTYFENCNLDSWELKYCIDNDDTRFSWADTTNGKGVIYHMEDEWGNVCPYDFKNIQFKRFAITKYDKVPSLVVGNGYNGYGYYYGAMQLDGTSQVIDGAVYGEDFEWLYTFALKDLAAGTWHDYTVVAHLGLKNDEGIEVTCYGNKLSQCRDEYNSGAGNLVTVLNDVVFMNCYRDLSDTSYSDDYSYCYLNVLSDDCYSNTFGNSCSSNTFGNECYSNTFGNDFRYNTFGNNIYYNTFGTNCYSNTFGNSCYSNAFGDSCQYNTFGNGIGSNTFGESCSSNTFGNECYNNTFGYNNNNNTFGNGIGSNTFGNSCQYNTFGNSCSSNAFGNSCSSNTFGNGIGSNTFGNGFLYNTFGNDCYRNTFGNECYNNTFGNECYNNTFGNDYIRWCAFGDGVQHCSITGYSTGSSNYLQNIIVLNGTRGTNRSNLLSLSGLSVGVSYSQTCGKNSSGTYIHKNVLD